MKSILNYITFIASRNFVIYLIIGALFILIFDANKMVMNVNLAVLNRLRPPTYKSLFNRTATATELDNFARYYRKVTDILPNQADAQGLYGYMLYQQGRVDQAIAAYRKAAELQPDFFWFHYNLGIIYFQQEEYEKAFSSIRQALTVDQMKTLNTIVSSRRVYLPLIVHQSNDMKQFIVSQFERDFHNATKILRISLYLQQQKNPQKPAQIKDLDLNLALF